MYSRKKTRFFAAVLAVSMLASLLPAGALAEDLQGSSAASSLAAAVSSSAVSEDTSDAVTSGEGESASKEVSASSAADSVPEDAVDSDTTLSGDPDTAAKEPQQAAAPQADESEPTVPAGTQAMTFLQEMRFLQSEPDSTDFNKLSNPDTGWTGDKIQRDAQGWLWFHYKVPQEKLQRGAVYTLDITGALLPTDTVDYTVSSYDENHDIIASGKVSQTDDGLHLTFTVAEKAPDDYLKAGVNGYFWVQAKLDAGKIGNNGNQTVNITANGTVTADPKIDFVLDDVVPTITTTKSKVTVNENTNTITWGIESTASAKNLPTTTSDGQFATITFTDTLPEGLTYVEDSAHLVTGDGLTTDGLKVTATVNEDKTVTFVVTPVPLTSTDCKIRVEYDTTYSEESLVENKTNAPMSSGTKKYINTVATKADGPVYKKGPDGRPEYTGDRKDVTPPSDATATAEFPLGSITKYVHTVTEAGAHTLLKDGCLYWTIDVDTGVLKTPYLVDTMGAGQSLEIDKDHPFRVTSDDDTVLFALTDPADITELRADHNASNTFGLAKKRTTGSGTSYEMYLQSGHKKLHISYYTHLIGGADNTITNKAALYDGQNIDPGIHAEKSLTLGQTFGIKEGNYDPTTQQILWTVTIHNGGYHDTEQLSLDDTFGTEVHQDLQTDQDIKLVVKKPNETDEGTVYTYDKTTHKFVNGNIILATLDKKQDNGVDTGFTITFTDTGKNAIRGFQHIILTYTTRLRSNDGPNDTKDLRAWLDKNIMVNNSLTIKTTNDNKQSITVNGTVTANTPVLKKESAGYDYSTREASWKITVNEAKMALSEPTVTDALAQNGKTVTDWWYDTTSLKVTQGDTELAADRYTVTYSDFLDSSQEHPTKMVIKLPSTQAGDNPYIITYKTQVAPTALATNSSQKITNTATLTGGPIQNTTIQKSADQTVNRGVLSKNGQKDTNFGTSHLYNWTLTVNNNLADLSNLEEGNTITVYDDLPEGMTYKAGTTKVVKQNVAANGNLTDAGEFKVIEGEPSQATDTQAIVSYDSYTRKYRLTFTKAALNQTAYKVTFATRILVPSNNYNNRATIGVEDPTGKDTSSAWHGSILYSGGFSMIVTDDDVGTVLIRKKNFKESSYLSGVVFRLDKWNDATKEWVEYQTFTSGGEITQEVDGKTYRANAYLSGLEYGHYRVTEIQTSGDPYILDKAPREFTLSDKNRIQEFDWINYTPEDGGTLVLTKTITGPVDKAALAKALTFTVYKQNADGTRGDVYGSYLLDDFIQDNGQWTKTLEHVPAGTYLVEETGTGQTNRTLTVTTTLTTAGGIQTTANSEAVGGVAVEPGSHTTTVAYQNDYRRTVQISKRSLTGAGELPGASLTLTDDDGKEWGNWTSTTTPKTLQLPAGNYTLTETAALDGYDVADPIHFTISADGNLSSDALDDDTTIVMRDAEQGYLTLTKTITGDVTEEEAKDALTFTVAGSNYQKTFTLGSNFTKDKDGTWTLTLQLPKGNYTVAEQVKGIPGMTLTSVTVNWTIAAQNVTGNGTYKAETNVQSETTQTVAYTNDYHLTEFAIDISKADAATSQEIAGARLKIEQLEGRKTWTVAEWTSGSDGTAADGTLNPHHVQLITGKYRLTEILTPDHYDTAESIDFTVGPDGKVTLDAGPDGDVKDDGRTLVMRDAPKGTIVLTKTIQGPVTREEAEEVLQFQVEKLADGTKTTYALKDFDTYNPYTHTWVKVLEESQGGYRVTETVTDIYGYGLAQASYVVGSGSSADGTAADLTLPMGKSLTVAFTNRYTANLHEIRISKQDATTGQELAGARLTLTDKATGQVLDSWLSGSEGRDADGALLTHRIELVAGTYTLAETEAPDGYAIADPITFTINKAGLVSGSSRTVTMQDKPLSDVSTGTNQSAKTAGPIIPRTADDFPMMALLAALFLSALGFAILYLRTRKANKKK